MTNKHNKENWKLLEDLLIPSWNGDYTNIIDVITYFVKNETKGKIELQKVEDKKFNVIVEFGNPEFLLNCHMDTVPVTGKWNTDPFKLTPNKIYTKFYGLGTCDTKGNLWTILQACAETNPENLMLAFTVDEEKGTASGMENLIEEDKLKNIKEAIVFEPTNCNFITKHKGYYSFIIDIKTKGGHSSTKQDVFSNAIVVGSIVSQKLFKQGFNIGKIQGGKAGNIVADECQLKVSIRTYESIKKIESEIKNTIKNEIDNSKIDIELKYVGIPLNNSSSNFVDNDILQNLIKKDNEVDFWTEAALIQNIGIKTIVYGAGSIKQAHKENEFVEISELIKCKNQIKEIISNINIKKSFSDIK